MVALLRDDGGHRSSRRLLSVFWVCTLLTLAAWTWLAEEQREPELSHAIADLAEGTAPVCVRTPSGSSSTGRYSMNALSRIFRDQPRRSRSAWLNDNGVLSLSPNPLDSVYRTMAGTDGDTYTCDDVVTTESGTPICENRMVYSRALLAASEPAQLTPSTSHILASLAGKRVLLMGDSIERFLMVGFRDSVPNGTFRTHTLSTPSTEGDFDGPGGRVAILPTGVEDAPLEVDFLHYYGLDESVIWGGRLDRRDPNEVAFAASERFEQMLEVWPGADRYQVIVLDFGLCELARHQHEAYAEHGVDAYDGLPAEWVTDYIVRFRRMIQRARFAYPSARIVVRQLHGVAWYNAGGWFVPEDLPPETPRADAFTPLRVFQLRQAQAAVAAAEGVELFTWANRMLGQADGALLDTIQPAEPGMWVYAEMLLRLTAETC